MINFNVILAEDKSTLEIISIWFSVLFGVGLLIFGVFQIWQTSKNLKQREKQHEEKIRLEKQKQFDDKQYRRLKFIKDFSKLNDIEREFINLYEKKYLETDVTLGVKELEKELNQFNRIKKQ